MGRRARASARAPPAAARARSGAPARTTGPTSRLPRMKRASASYPATRPVRRSTIGWNAGAISSRSIASSMSLRPCSRPSMAIRVRLAVREAPGRAVGRARPRRADRRGHRQGDARDPPRAARGGRQLQGRQAVHGDGQGARGRRRGHQAAQPGPAGRQDRRRGADEADGRPGGRHHLLAAPADGDPHGRPAGLGQDDRDGQARQATSRSSTGPPSASRPATSTGRPRSSS